MRRWREPALVLGGTLAVAAVLALAGCNHEDTATPTTTTVPPPVLPCVDDAGVPGLIPAYDGVIVTWKHDPCIPQPGQDVYVLGIAEADCLHVGGEPSEATFDDLFTGRPARMCDHVTKRWDR